MIGGISGIGSYGMGSVGSFYQSRLTENIRNAKIAQQAQQKSLVPMARKAASPETPVEPVRPARPVFREEASLPELTSRLENDPAAMAGRMRMRVGDVDPEGNFVEAGKEGLSPVDGSRKSALDGESALGAESAQKALEEGECQTCEKRKYQDGSDDMGVSFQTPTNVKPEVAPSAVRGHEMEHVYREQAKAGREGREVVSQTVTMHTEICPECGKSFVSGGTTETVTRAKTENDLQQDLARQKEEEQKTRTPFSAVA